MTRELSDYDVEKLAEAKTSDLWGLLWKIHAVENTTPLPQTKQQIKTFLYQIIREYADSPHYIGGGAGSSGD